MDLNAVETSLDTSLCSVCEILCDSMYLGNLQWSRRMAGIVGSVDSWAGDWDIGGADCLVTLKESIRRCSSNVPDLAVDETAFGVNCICDSLPSCTLSWCEDSWNAWVS